MAIVPSAQHEDGSIRDLHAWTSRGWCRAERLVNHLSPEPKDTMIVESMLSRYILEPKEWIYDQVGFGRFTVDEDKVVLGEMIDALLDRRIQHAQVCNDVDTMRMCKALRGLFLAGTGRYVEIVEGFEEWMADMAFASVDDRAASGWTPLRFALYAKNLVVAKELIRRRADVEASPPCGVGFC